MKTMPEASKIPTLSVKPKQHPRRQKSPKKKQTPGKRESRRTKAKQELANATCQSPSVPEEKQIKIVPKNFANESPPMRVKKNVAPMRVQRKENDYGPIYFNPLDFENSRVNFLRTSLYFLITCQWCFKLFNFEREPCNEYGLTACSICIKALFKTTEDTAKGYFPLDISYITAVNRVHQIYNIFKSDIPYYNELERAIWNKNLFGYSRRLPSADLCQKYLLLSNSNEHKVSLVKQNEVKVYTTFLKMCVVDNFKSNVMKSHEFCSTQLSAWEIYENIEECGSLLLGERNFKFPVPESLDDLLPVQICTKLSKGHGNVVFSNLVYKLTNQELELYLYVDVNGKRLYATVFAVGVTVYVQTFKPKFPLITSVGLAHFLRLDDNLIPSIPYAYFEIAPEKNPLSVRYGSEKGFRCYLVLGVLDYSLQTAKLFLGSSNLSYLGAEVDVTEDRVTFNYYMKDGKPMVGNIEEPILWEFWRVPSFSHRGMIVSHSVDNINKLIIYKHNDPTDLVNLVVGYIEECSYGPLMQLPLGKHKIFTSGIGIRRGDINECKD